MFTASSALATKTLKTLPKESPGWMLLLASIAFMGLQDPRFAHLVEPLAGSLSVLAAMFVGAEVWGRLKLERVDQLVSRRLSFDVMYWVLFKLRSGRPSSNLSFRDMRKVLDHQSSELLRLRRQILIQWDDLSAQERRGLAFSYLEEQANHLEYVQFALFLSSNDHPGYNMGSVETRCLRALLRHVPAEVSSLGI